ncbi:unnamed protein product [Rotaria socialis]|uniref:Uncharacterized protein n=4 Tax=Rotaria socialis TaxID=392032 RepID=A0A817QN46_9BILA|nr:unnamed protein product [Rotaria socialis]CAF3338196.1 unnamed protein product [Rotaria socialis]
MSSMYSGVPSYQYPQGSARPYNQPMNYGNNQRNQDYSISSSHYVDRRPINPALTNPTNRSQYYSTNVQDYSIPPSLYVERRASNPAPVGQYNQPQYIEPTNSSLGYNNARAIQAQGSSMYHQKNPGTPSRNVNSALKVNPSPLPPPSPPKALSQYAINSRENVLIKKDIRSEIDDSPIIDPRAFQYLNLDNRKAQQKPISAANESGIDARPIVNFDAVTQLEKRRQQQIEKNNRLRGDDGSGSGIDGRPIVDINAFRHIEAKAYKKKDNEQQGQGTGGGIDERPITNFDAIKDLETRRQQKTSNVLNESIIDTRPIINPDAFKYLEKRRDNSVKTYDEGGIDTKPIVNPEAFRYLEQRGPPLHRDIESGVDTKSIVDPNAFKYLENKETSKSAITESTIDYRPIVNPQAFKWIERKEPKPRVDDGPEVDERSYINPNALQYVDRPPPMKKTDVCEPEIDTRSFILDRNPGALAHLERTSSNRKYDTTESGVDERSFVNPNAFKYLEGMSEAGPPQTSVHSSAGPCIDTKSYVKPDSFRHLESKTAKQEYGNNNNDQGVDERSFVPPTAFRHLEFTGEPTNPEPINYATYGQSDF